MCRMLLLHIVEYEDSSGIIEELLDGLRTVARSDPLLRGKSHSDGWGYIVISNDKLYEYHSYEPVYSDEKYDELRGKLGDNTYALIHVRRAGSDQPLGLLHTHPYHFHTSKDIDAWYAFNGSTIHSGYGLRTDAFLLARELNESCSMHGELKTYTRCIFTEYSKRKDKVKSGGSLALLATNGSTTSLCFYPLYKTSKTYLRKYYEYYLYETGKLAYIASSSIIKITKLEAEPIPEENYYCL